MPPGLGGASVVVGMVAVPRWPARMLFAKPTTFVWGSHNLAPALVVANHGKGGLLMKPPGQIRGI